MTTVSGELSSIGEGPQLEYKIKEYVFECQTVHEWIYCDIEESDAFIDGSTYIETNVTNGKQRISINFKYGNREIRCYISYENGKKQIAFESAVDKGTVHAFVHYK